jgi:hypothetical protein
MGGFRVCIYMGLSPSLYFRHLKITYCINFSSPCPVYPFGSTNCQRACSQFFGVIAAYPPHTQGVTDRLTLTDVGAWWIQYGTRSGPDALSLYAMLHGRNTGIYVKRSVLSGTYAWRLDEEVHRTLSQWSHGLTRDVHSRRHAWSPYIIAVSA